MLQKKNLFIAIDQKKQTQYADFDDDQILFKYMKIKIHVHRCQSVYIFVIKLISCNQGKKN